MVRGGLARGRGSYDGHHHRCFCARAVTPELSSPARGPFADDECLGDAGEERGVGPEGEDFIVNPRTAGAEGERRSVWHERALK